MVTSTAIVVIEAMTISGQRRLFNQTHCLQIIPRAPGMQLSKFSQMLGGPFADAAAFFFFELSTFLHRYESEKPNSWKEIVFAKAN